MSLTSGVSSALDPEFNLWDSIEPYATQLLRDESGNLVQDALKEAVSIAGVAVRLPKRLDAVVSRIEEGNLSVKTPALDQRIGRLERVTRRLIAAVLFSGFLVAGAVLLPTVPAFGIVLMSVSALPLIYVVVGGRRR
jgi:predicted unusual protein kinase regulating ubiquinone biosynthesis (AarF/ABC1/UbiB family)